MSVPLRWVCAAAAGLASVALALLPTLPYAAAAPPSRPLGALPALPRAGVPALPAVDVVERRVPVGPEPDGTPVSLDVSVYRPAGTAPSGGRPLVLLAHGFGGSKADLDGRARDLADRGYLSIAFSARGFGESGGLSHLSDPDFEIADGRVLVDLAAAEPGVRLDGPGDPRLAVVGASYGGAFGLMLASTDPRVDSVVAAITWHDLADAFAPQHVVSGAPANTAATVDRVDTPGPFKQLWASRFFGAGAVAQAPAPGSASPPPSASPAPSASPSSTPSPSSTASLPPSASGSTAPGGALCGRIDPGICGLFLQASATGTPSTELLALLRAHSPRPLLGGLRAATFLVQGMRDTLFGVEQADATARAITGQVPRLAVRWIDGGHDSASSTPEADEQAVRDWLAETLLGAVGSETRDGTVTAQPGFVWAAPVPRRRTVAPLVAADTYPGPATWSTLALTPTEARTVVNPPGGQPASITALPGPSDLLGGGAAYQLAALPGQSAAFDSGPLAERRAIVGAPRVTLTVTSTSPQPSAETVLFLSLWQVTGQVASLPRRTVAPVRVLTRSGEPTTVEVALAPGTWTVEAGSSLRLLVTTTDSLYAAPRTARADRIAVQGAQIRLPDVAGRALTPTGDTDTESVGVGLGIAGLLLLAGASAWWERRRRRRIADRPELADVPLVVDRLVKTYRDGHRAVDDVSWRAERGQVVGLLGPNGAGKTTTLRMVMGLIHPDSGAAYLGGRAVHPGAPALAEVGALVEGPGFLPHLSGRDNLRAFWAATGRPEHEARFDEVAEVAALGGALDRPVRSYSQGMRQRLGIAQAMLGMPDLLVLDEPTNGLDPPQIAAMRPILQRYAAGGPQCPAGRTVVVSSHLLAEVEQTCSHVVVMHAGRVVTTGRVSDLLDSADTTVAELAPTTTPAEVAAVAARLREVAGIGAVEVVEDEGDPRLVVTASLPRASVVRSLTAVGADVVGVSSRRHLEEVFLGVIAAAAHPTPDTSVTEQLRQVRAR